MIYDYITIDPVDGFFESHKNYIDIQLVLCGFEHIRFVPQISPVVTACYKEDNDVELYQLSKRLSLDLVPGCFALFRAGELHAPKLASSSASEDFQKPHKKSLVKKESGKISISEYLYKFRIFK
jgi:YhcH/YjgK/YiaL family protein